MKKINIEICVGTSCYLLGAQDVMASTDRLSQDIKDCVIVKGVTCLNRCGQGPNVRIDGEIYSGVTPEILIELIRNKLG